MSGPLKDSIARLVVLLLLLRLGQSFLNVFDHTIELIVELAPLLLRHRERTVERLWECDLVQELVRVLLNADIALSALYWLLVGGHTQLREVALRDHCILMRWRTLDSQTQEDDLRVIVARFLLAFTKDVFHLSVHLEEVILPIVQLAWL